MNAPAPTAAPDFRFTPVQKKALQVLGATASDQGLGGGARSGKTFTFCYGVATRALAVPDSRHAILRFRHNAVIRSVVKDTFPKMMDLCYPGVWSEKDLDKTYWYWKCPNGSEIWFSGLDDKDRVENILGNEYGTMYFNECSQIPWQSVKTALTRLAQKCKIPQKDPNAVAKFMRLKAFYDLNPPSKRHWTYRYFIERKSPDTGKPLLHPETISFLFMNPLDNADNLDPAFLQRLDSMPPKERQRFFLGQFSDEDSDALWTDELYDATRVEDTSQLPDMVRVVVAVDPSGCADDDPDSRSDEIGIVVAGLGTDGLGYLLEDLSGHYGPHTWGKIAADAFRRHRADRIVAESNYGGAMVKATIEAANDSGENLPVFLVNASRGKIVRAEPIAALYQRGRIKHVGYFPEIEEQGGSFYPDGYKGLRSPDRKDAVIWAFTELFPSLTEENSGKIWVPPSVSRNQKRASAYGNSGTPGQPKRRR